MNATTLQTNDGADRNAALGTPRPAPRTRQNPRQSSGFFTWLLGLVLAFFGVTPRPDRRTVASGKATGKGLANRTNASIRRTNLRSGRSAAVLGRSDVTWTRRVATGTNARIPQAIRSKAAFSVAAVCDRRRFSDNSTHFRRSQSAATGLLQKFPKAVSPLRRAPLVFLQVAERLLTVAVGFIPRTGAGIRRVAERQLKIQRHGIFNRRSATRTPLGSVPWDESHGYHHFLAPREVSQNLRSDRSSDGKRFRGHSSKENTTEKSVKSR